MIEKMQFLSITGPKDDIDRAIDQHLSKYEFQLESTMTELSETAGLKPFIEINPYRETLNKAAALLAAMGVQETETDDSMSVEEAVALIDETDLQIREAKKSLEKLNKDKEELQDLKDKIAPFDNLGYDVHKLLSFKSVKYRFGRIPADYVDKLMQYTYDNVNTIFCECNKDEDYVWGVYFSPKNEIAKIDAVYKALHFERFRLPDEYEGTPAEALASLAKYGAEMDEKIKEKQGEINQVLASKKDRILAAVSKLNKYSRNFDIRRLAACTGNEKTYYIICFWMTARDAKKLQAELDQDEKVICIVHDDNKNRVSTPPVKLRNPKLFKPYEMYIRMYGLPNYNEFDPTIFVALTYSFIFGWMFGDVGQGLVLTIGGFLLYHFKHMNLAAIISMAGVFSTFFGFMFGSIFGFEDVLEPIWLRPMSNMTNLPMIGRLNTVFIVAVAFGMGLILLTMVIHIINAIRNHNLGDLCFDTNGIAGLVFYGMLVFAIVMLMTGHSLPGGVLLAVLFIVPLICIAFKEQLTQLCEKKKPAEKTGAVMIVVQAVFELIEVLLSYFSNTISFVRIGAFAVSHAAMMEVVLMLAGAESGNPNILVVILGNLFVCGMEGLIVGIQVLRLEYYEMFSRFYKGDGREFKPYNTKQ